MRSALLPVIYVLMLAACSKDEAATPGITTSWVAHVDSTCVMLPNVITPNADGINDVLVPMTHWATSCTLIVRTQSFETIFSTTQSGLGWTGLAPDGTPAPSGWYIVSARAKTLMGQELFVSGYLRLVRDPQSECVPASLDITTPDMLDPRLCGERPYPSNDLFVRCP